MYPDVGCRSGATASYSSLLTIRVNTGRGSCNQANRVIRGKTRDGQLGMRSAWLSPDIGAHRDTPGVWISPPSGVTQRQAESGAMK